MAPVDRRHQVVGQRDVSDADPVNSAQLGDVHALGSAEELLEMRRAARLWQEREDTASVVVQHDEHSVDPRR